MKFIEQLKDRARQDVKRIVLPEGEKERTLRAADTILEEGFARIILLGNRETIEQESRRLVLKNISQATIIDPQDHDHLDEYADMLYEIRKNKGMERSQALELVKNPLYLAVMMIKNGDADGEVAGAENATGDVLRPAFQVVKTKPGISVVSGAFIMVLPDKSFGEEGMMIFADGAVHPNPTAPELAEIAVATADTARNLVGIDPRVAMLSFSTKGSARHEMVDKVAEATALARKMAPSLMIDGELQVDAAIVPEIAQYDERAGIKAYRHKFRIPKKQKGQQDPIDRLQVYD